MKSKEEYRNYYRRLREKMSAEEVEKSSSKLVDNLLSLKIVQESESVMVYVSFSNEVKTVRIIDHLLGRNKSVYVPYCKNNINELGYGKINGWHNLVEGNYGILEPDDNLREPNVDSELLDLILVPGLVFSENGYRIGYGGGYYDRLLDEMDDSVISIGLIYDQFLIDSLPSKSYDRKVDFVVTDLNIIDCNREDKNESF